MKSSSLTMQLHLGTIKWLNAFYIKFIIFCKIVYKQIELFLITVCV